MARKKVKVRRSQTDDPTKAGKSKYALKLKRRRRGEETRIIIPQASTEDARNIVMMTMPDYNGDHPNNWLNRRIEQRRGTLNAGLPDFNSRKKRHISQSQ